MKKNIRGVSLVELTIAVSFLAVSFIPIMALLSSNLKITERDRANIDAMNLCQEKLDKALSLKFNAFDKYVNNGKDNQGETIFNTTITDSDGLILDLTDYSSRKGDIVYHFELNVSDRPGEFRVCRRDLNPDVELEEFADSDSSSDVDKYIFLEESTVKYTGMVHRYKMRVWWQDKVQRSKSGPGSIIKDYTLVSFKANLKSGG